MSLRFIFVAGCFRHVACNGMPRKASRRVERRLDVPQKLRGSERACADDARDVRMVVRGNVASKSASSATRFSFLVMRIHAFTLTVTTLAFFATAGAEPARERMAEARERFDERLELTPLADGKVLAHWEFRTRVRGGAGDDGALCAGVRAVVLTMNACLFTFPPTRSPTRARTETPPVSTVTRPTLRTYPPPRASWTPLLAS